MNVREVLTEPAQVQRWGVLLASLALPLLVFGLEALLSSG